MYTSYSSLLFKFNWTKWLAVPHHRRFVNNAVLQCNFTPVSDEAESDEQNSLEKILNTVPPESEALSPTDTLNIFRKLSETTLKQPQLLTTSYNVVDHHNFGILRNAMRASAAYLKTNEKLDVLNAIQTLSVPVDDDVFNAVLSSFLDNIFNMSLNDIMILDHVLIFRQSNKLAMELHQSLIDRFNAKASQFPVEFNFFIKTRRMLQFIARNRNQIIDEVFINMGNCAAKQKIDIFTASEAMDVIILLSHFGDRCEYFRPLLDKALDVWCLNEVTIQMVEIVQMWLVRRKSILNYKLYKDPRLIETCAQVAIAHGDIEMCFRILRQLNRLEFSSKRLIDFLLESLKEEKNIQNQVHRCVSICIACDIGNHRPPLFDDFLHPVLSTMNFHQQFDIKLNWPKFALRLHNFGIYHKPLINEILKQKKHFESFDKVCVAELESLQMEKLVNAEIGHLLTNLKQLVGEQQLRLLVHVEYGIVIPMLVKIDIHSKKLVRFRDNETNLLSSIRCDDNQCLVAITKSSSQDVQPFRPDVVTIILDSLEWARLLQHQTEAEFFTEVHHRVQDQKFRQTQTDLFQ